MNKKNIYKYISVLLICFNLFFISACTAYEQGLKSIIPLSYNSFNSFANVNDFKEFYRKNITLETGIEEQRDIVLRNIYNAQNFLSHLDLKITIISREEMTKIASELKTDTFAGLYKPEDKEIILVGYDSDTSIHELGHAVFYQLLNKPEKNTVSEYFGKESKGLIDKYGQVSEEEFFAVSFTEYIYSPATLKSNCPNIYEFIDTLSNKLNK